MKPNPCSRLDSMPLLVLSGLPGDECEALLEHAGSCRQCADELRRLRAAMAELDLRASLAELEAGARVPGHLAEALQGRVELQRGAGSLARASVDEFDEADEAQPWRAWARAEPLDREVDKGFVTVRADDTAWVPTTHTGVSVRPLSVDPARRAVTMLIRMEAGASYPPHRHAAREECFVLDGDLDVDGTPMRAGDYQVAEGASIHGWQSTRGGCTLLIVSSQDDELLPT